MTCDQYNFDQRICGFFRQDVSAPVFPLSQRGALQHPLAAVTTCVSVSPPCFNRLPFYVSGTSFLNEKSQPRHFHIYSVVLFFSFFLMADKRSH